MVFKVAREKRVREREREKERKREREKERKREREKERKREREKDTQINLNCQQLLIELFSFDQMSLH
jgi:hypothetical protein